MNGQQARSRTAPILLGSAAAMTVPIAAAALWFGWPQSPTSVPDGTSQVEVYTISDHPALTTPSVIGAEDGWFGRFSFPCGVDAWHVESAGTAVCASLNGPLGTVTVTLRNDGKQIELPADSRQAVTGWITDADDSGSGPATRALLVRDGDPVGIVTVTAPATAVPAS
ncbi:MAG TPA: hypothetical protein VN408_38570 [Actinoplanes sp.]|nr:hypothetical protein [Actinoplanes sp.]